MGSVTHDQLLRFLQAQRLGIVASISPAGDPQSAVVGIAVTNGWRSCSTPSARHESVKTFGGFRRFSIVTGWDQEITVQYEGVADEPSGAELERIKACYFGVYPDGVERQQWDGITYFRIRPMWIRYTDFNAGGGMTEFSAQDLYGP